jgi:transposase InsO family protein
LLALSGHSDNGSSYVAGDLAKWLEGKGMEHVRAEQDNFESNHECCRVLPWCCPKKIAVKGRKIAQKF